MTATRTCTRCGTPLPPTGECPRCLLRLGLELPPRDPAGPPGTAGSDAPPPPAPRPPPPSLEDIARRFPQLEIKSLLGQGGMGVVYRARQPRLDREVALKVLPPELSSQPHFAERFLREARAMARLSHANIVAVHDFGETDGLCWLMMELVDGVNLRQALKSGALAPEKALAVVPQMCDALQYAHDEGVVHRDIKPENVLLDRAGRVKIADFGLAKLVGAQDVSITRETQVFGTPHYMAPEQMEGARDVDHRADIFSLGVVFYEMLTGRLPVGRFDPPSRRVHVDVRLDEVVLHALEHEPERRYQHVSEVKTDIEDVAAGKAPGVAHGEPIAGAGVPKRLRGFAGVWLEWPKKKGEAAVRAGTGLSTGGPSGVQPGRLVWATRIGWRGVWSGLAMIAWAAFAWWLAGEAAARGRGGPVVGLALMIATAGVFAAVCLRVSPALREALAAERWRIRALRYSAAAFAAAGAMLLIGQGVVEGWEHGTLHYVSDARDPVSWLLPGDLAPAPAGEADAAPSSADWQILQPEQTEDLSQAAAWSLGVLLLLAFGLAVAFRPLDGAVARAGVAVSFGVAALLLLGLGALALWNDAHVAAESWPSLVPVQGRVELGLAPHDAAIALQSALQLQRYSVQADEPFVTAADSRIIEEHLALEPSAPQDRWSLEGGLPRRRRPHVTLRIRRVDEDSQRCTVDWDCGRVRPVAAEPAAWKEWIERILSEAPRFTGSAAGG